MKTSTHPLKKFRPYIERTISVEDQITHITLFAIATFLIDCIDDYQFSDKPQVEKLLPLLEKIESKAWTDSYFSDNTILNQISNEYVKHLNWLTKSNANFCTGIMLFKRCIVKNNIKNEEFEAVKPELDSLVKRMSILFEANLRYLNIDETEFYEKNEKYTLRIIQRELRKQNKFL